MTTGTGTTPRRRVVVIRLLIVVLIVVIVGWTVWGLGRRLIYFPADAPPPVADVLPGAVAVSYSTADGLELSGWYLPAGPVAVMVLPGNAGNRAARAPLARALAGAGLSVLLVDYRGYGGNPGSPSESGLAADARAAEQWLRGRPGVDDVVILGESLGAAVAVGLVANRPPDRPADRRPAALVLRSPFTSLGDVARAHYGPVPDWLLRDRYPLVDRIDEVDAPLLVVAGADDTIVPSELSRRVFAAAGEPKRLVVVPGAGHNDAALTGGGPLTDAVVGFLADHGLLDGA